VHDACVLPNRSMPSDVIVPVLGYPSVTEAVHMLGATFGFGLRWQVGEHRAQVSVGPDAAIAIVQGARPQDCGDHVMVRVADVVAHRQRAKAAGAEVTAVQEHAYGERQYSATDFAGRRWVFSESVADVAPEDWGATVPPSPPVAPATRPR
jgi:hypothetical protein